MIDILNLVLTPEGETKINYVSNFDIIHLHHKHFLHGFTIYDNVMYTIYSVNMIYIYIYIYNIIYNISYWISCINKI